MKKIYFIGIGGTGISWLARYYQSIGYEVSGSDKHASEITEKLTSEWIHCVIGETPERISWEMEKVIYSSAIPLTQIELLEAKKKGIQTLTYPEWLAEVTDKLALISIAGTHGKSTTTSLISLILKDSQENFSSIVGSILTEFWGNNFFHRDENTAKKENYFVLESCEYKRNFLNYHPFIAVITNIEADHLDYYKDENDYVLAFEQFIGNIRSGGFVLLGKNDKNSRKLLEKKRTDITYVLIGDNDFEINGRKEIFPQINMLVPWDHILFDAHLAFVVGKLLEIDEKSIISSLENYRGIRRRMEKIGTTPNGNLVMSDYGHHPTEILATTKALKEKYTDKKLLVIFQPHQYSRTIELLEWFKTCFTYCDTLIVPNIYESRDSEADKQKMNGQIFINQIEHTNKYFWDGFENTLKLIDTYEKENRENTIILLLGAGDVDSLRYKIKVS